MKYLFVHDAFPGQFVHLLRTLHRTQNVDIVAASRKGSTLNLPVRQVVYQASEAQPKKGPPLGPLREAAALAYDLFTQLRVLKKDGWEPDYIVTHASTGASHALRELFPNARITAFLEWYYQNPPATSAKTAGAYYQTCAANAARNSIIARDFEQADAAYAPTVFQRSQFPVRWQPDIQVCHEGIDTDRFKPDLGAQLHIGEHVFSTEDEIITYAARGMEKSRGFPAFMKAIALVQSERPRTQVLIAGADRLCYDPGRGKPGLKGWAERTVDYDAARTHFVGLLPEREFAKMLQVSSLHAYLSIPFVLSWSCLNAMSTGVSVLASDNVPVREVVDDGKNGTLVDLTSPEQIAAAMLDLLNDSGRRQAQGATARETVLKRFELEDCVARQLAIIHGH